MGLDTTASLLLVFGHAILGLCWDCLIKLIFFGLGVGLELAVIDGGPILTAPTSLKCLS